MLHIEILPKVCKRKAELKWHIITLSKYDQIKCKYAPKGWKLGLKNQ